MEDQASSKSWLANGNLRLAIIAAALVLVLAGTQLGSNDPAAAAVDAVGDGVSDTALVEDLEPVADVVATPTLTPTPVPAPVAEPLAEPEVSEEPDAEEFSREEEGQTPLIGTTLAAGTGGAVVVLPGNGTATTTLDADLLVSPEGETVDEPIVCVLPEVPAETLTEASDAGEQDAEESDEGEGDVEQPDESEPEPAPVVDAWFNDTFEDSSGDWQPLSGSWEVEGGAYVQTDATGYDFITELNRRPPSEFLVEVDITAPGLLNAGLIIGQPEAGTRAGATIIDFTEDGTFLRWGSYEPGTSQYRYVGGARLGDDFDPSATVRLGIERREDRTFVSIGGREIAAIDPIPEGRLGLVTSVSVAAFSNFAIEDLSQ